MNIIVSVVDKWGKILFYPESEDAIFLAQFTGRPTLLIQQLRMAVEKGWSVNVLQKQFDLNEYFLKKNL